MATQMYQLEDWRYTWMEVGPHSAVSIHMLLMLLAGRLRVVVTTDMAQWRSCKSPQNRVHIYTMAKSGYELLHMKADGTSIQVNF